MEADVDRLDINECIKQFGLNNSNSKLRDLDIDKMKAVTIDMKHWSHVVDKKVLKNTKSKKLNTKVNNLEKKSWYIYFNSEKSEQHRQARFEEENLLNWE